MLKLYLIIIQISANELKFEEEDLWWVRVNIDVDMMTWLVSQAACFFTVAIFDLNANRQIICLLAIIHVLELRQLVQVKPEFLQHLPATLKEFCEEVKELNTRYDEEWIQLCSPDGTKLKPVQIPNSIQVKITVSYLWVSNRVKCSFLHIRRA